MALASRRRRGRWRESACEPSATSRSAFCSSGTTRCPPTARHLGRNGRVSRNQPGRPSMLAATAPSSGWLQSRSSSASPRACRCRRLRRPPSLGRRRGRGVSAAPATRVAQAGCARDGPLGLGPDAWLPRLGRGPLLGVALAPWATRKLTPVFVAALILPAAAGAWVCAGVAEIWPPERAVRAVAAASYPGPHDQGYPRGPRCPACGPTVAIAATQCPRRQNEGSHRREGRAGGICPRHGSQINGTLRC